MKKKGNKFSKKPLKKLKYPLDRATIKALPDVYEEMQYTPQELRLRFKQYLERADKNGEEITISTFTSIIGVHSQYLYKKKDSQGFCFMIDRIMTVFESRYEQSLAKGVPVSYLMNNRWKGKRESLQKNENTDKVHPDVRATLDSLIKKYKK